MPGELEDCFFADAGVAAGDDDDFGGEGGDGGGVEGWGGGEGPDHFDRYF